MKFKLPHIFSTSEIDAGEPPLWLGGPVPAVISYALSDRRRRALGTFTDLMYMYSFVLSREDRSAVWRVHGPDELAGYTDPDGLPAYYLRVERT